MRGYGYNSHDYWEKRTIRTKLYAKNANCGATVWQHNFSGWKARFSIGNYNMQQFMAAGAMNDHASSIIVDQGCKAIIYQHGNFNGWAATFQAGKYPLSTWASHGARNDQMSSIRVMPANRRILAPVITISQ